MNDDTNVRQMIVEPNVAVCDQTNARAIDKLRKADHFILIVLEEIDGEERPVMTAVADIHFQVHALATLEAAIVSSVNAVGWPTDA